MIDVQDLRFKYPKAHDYTISDLNFAVEPGEIFGFLGPSGAGKSTTQNVLLGLLGGYEGQVNMLGNDLQSWGKKLYEQIGVSFEFPNHYLRLTAFENLALYSRYFEADCMQVDDLLEMVGLAQDHHKKVRDFSKGMKVRLNIARSLLNHPKCWFLDEPTSGLDPGNASKIKDLIREKQAQGTTVFVTTHDMLLADQVCDRVAFIVDGQIKVIDQPSTLKERFAQKTVKVTYQVDGNPKEDTFDLENLGKNEGFKALLEAGHPIRKIHSQEPNLEEVFLKVTGTALSS